MRLRRPAFTADRIAFQCSARLPAPAEHRIRTPAHPRRGGGTRVGASRAAGGGGRPAGGGGAPPGGGGGGG
ncbi:hypothetical protein, partial [Nocardia abscessus]|uniref:hypothetical protein n=1 Tax=Nocardia abscessus TaxID=120957 RepID=UPI0024545C09